MGGLVLDIVVVFLWKSATRAIQFIGSLRWKRTVASVREVIVLDPFLGCPSVRVYYRFDSTPRFTEGEDEVPFLLRWSAKQYAQRLSQAATVIVRVRSEKTLFFKLDHQ